MRRDTKSGKLNEQLGRKALLQTTLLDQAAVAELPSWYGKDRQHRKFQQGDKALFLTVRMRVSWPGYTLAKTASY